MKRKHSGKCSYFKRCKLHRIIINYILNLNWKAVFLLFECSPFLLSKRRFFFSFLFVTNSFFIMIILSSIYLRYYFIYSWNMFTVFISSWFLLMMRWLSDKMAEILCMRWGKSWVFLLPFPSLRSCRECSLMFPCPTDG